MQRYLIVIEGNGSSNYSAYSPDVPGCVATGATREECETAMREAISLHLDSLRQHNEPIPLPASSAAYVDV
jgi:predicted RNase H-like HicB family nuclease